MMGIVVRAAENQKEAFGGYDAIRFRTICDLLGVYKPMPLSIRRICLAYRLTVDGGPKAWMKKRV